MNVWSLIIQLISGALGGNAAGALMKKLSMGTVLNSILGIVGGGLGGQLLNLLGVGTAGGGLDLGDHHQHCWWRCWRWHITCYRWFDKKSAKQIIKGLTVV